MADNKIVHQVDLKSGDRTAVVDTKAIVEATDEWAERLRELDGHSRSLVMNMERMHQKMQQGAPVNREDTRNHERRAKAIKEQSELTKRAAQVEIDTSRRRRLERKAEILDMANTHFGTMPGGRAGGGMGGAGGGSLAPRLQPIETGGAAGTIERVVRDAAARVGGVITAGAGLLGLFEGFSLVSSAMAEFEQRALNTTRAGAMLGGAFAPVEMRVDHLRRAWGFLAEETLQGQMAMARTMGIAGTGNFYGAALAARAYAIPLPEAAAHFGTFERYTRGGAAGVSGFLAGDTGFMADIVPAVRPPRPIGTAGPSAGRTSFSDAISKLSAAGLSIEDADAFISSGSLPDVPSARTAVIEYKRILGGAPGGVAPEDASRDAAEKARMKARAAATHTPATAPGGYFPGGPIWAREKFGDPYAMGRAAAMGLPAPTGTGVSAAAEAGSIAARTAAEMAAATAGREALRADRYESVLLRAAARSGAPGLRPEFFESAAGLARTFAGRGGLANAEMVSGLLGLMTGPAWGGGAGIGYEPARAAETLGRLSGGLTAPGDDLSYTMKVRALSRVPGPVNVVTPHGKVSLDPRNPYHIRMLLENAMQSPEVFGSMMEEAKAFGGLAPRALAAMSGGAISETEALGFMTGEFDVGKFFARPASDDAMKLARTAMETPGGRLMFETAAVEANMEKLGEELGMLRHEIRSAVSAIANAITTGGIPEALTSISFMVRSFPGLWATLGAGHLLKGNVGAAAAFGVAAGMGMMAPAD